MIQNLEALLRTMSELPAFYVLGAGASAGLVPFTGQLRESIKKTYGLLGMYPAESGEHTPLFERVIGEYRGGQYWDYGEVVLRTITSGALGFLVQVGLSGQTDGPTPPSYELLHRVAAPSFFFSFNLDGLAAAYLTPRHVVVEPHGSTDREWVAQGDRMERLESALDAPLPSLRPKLLPGPEPLTITATAPFVRAQNYLRHTRASILIGYSFGKRSSGLDDSESFEYVVEHLRASRGTVFIVSPEPFELASLIEQEIRSKRVLPVPLYWDLFSRCVMTLSKRSLSQLAYTTIEREYLIAVDNSG